MTFLDLGALAKPSITTGADPELEIPTISLEGQANWRVGERMFEADYQTYLKNKVDANSGWLLLLNGPHASPQPVYGDLNPSFNPTGFPTSAFQRDPLVPEAVAGDKSVYFDGGDYMPSGNTADQLPAGTQPFSICFLAKPQVPGNRRGIFYNSLGWYLAFLDNGDGTHRMTVRTPQHAYITLAPVIEQDDIVFFCASRYVSGGVSGPYKYFVYVNGEFKLEHTTANYTINTPWGSGTGYVGFTDGFFNGFIDFVGMVDGEAFAREELDEINSSMWGESAELDGAGVPALDPLPAQWNFTNSEDKLRVLLELTGDLPRSRPFGFNFSTPAAELSLGLVSDAEWNFTSQTAELHTGKVLESVIKWKIQTQPAEMEVDVPVDDGPDWMP